MPSFVDTLPRSGLTIGDISPRFYRASGVSAGEVSSVTLTEVADDYIIAGPSPDALSLPSPLSSYCGITREIDGQSAAFEYGYSGTPAFVIIPIRISGLTTSSLSLRIYKSSIERSDITLACVEIGSTYGPGDYRISGWPIESDGAVWVLVWEYLGVVSMRSWTAGLPVTLSTIPDVSGSLFSGRRGRWAAGVIRKRAGGKVTVLRRANNISTQNLVLSSNVLSSATTLSIKSASGPRLTGHAIKGSVFTIAGIPGMYMLASDSIEAQVSGTLPITFVPALALGAATGAAVTFTRSYTDTPYPILTRQVSDVDQKAVDGGQLVRLLPFDPTKPAPRLNDTLDGVPIIRVQPISGDDTDAYYRCHIDGAKAATA